MDKDILRKFLEEELENHGLEREDAEEVADSVVDRCDEEGFFELNEEYDD